jgi:hypothetical protein
MGRESTSIAPEIRAGYELTALVTSPYSTGHDSSALVQLTRIPASNHRLGCGGAESS